MVYEHIHHYISIHLSLCTEPVLTINGKYHGCGIPNCPGQTASIYQVRRAKIVASIMSIPNTWPSVKESSGDTPEYRRFQCMPDPAPSNMEVIWHPRLMAVLDRRHKTILLPLVKEE